MKNRILTIIASMVAVTLVTGCADKNLPENPTKMSPISGLVINVNGENYTALPSLQEDGTFSSTYALAVKIPSRKAEIVQINFTDRSVTSDVKAGDEVEFVDNKLPITLYKNGQEIDKYWVEMSFNPPPFFYFMKTSDKDADGNRYFLDLDRPQIIASGTYDEWFDGFVDLTMSNWDNVGLISSDLTTCYDYAGGPWPAVSYYTWVGSPKATPGTGYYPCDGPWNDWKATNSNPEIVSPGVWNVNFNSVTHEVRMTMTQWCIAGSAVGDMKPMTYSSDTRLWTIDATLAAGSLRFKTTPVTFGDPTFDFGLTSGISELGEDGDDIQVQEPGNYTITLDLSNSPYYKYQLDKK